MKKTERKLIRVNFMSFSPYDLEGSIEELKQFVNRLDEGARESGLQDISIEFKTDFYDNTRSYEVYGYREELEYEADARIAREQSAERDLRAKQEREFEKLAKLLGKKV